MHMLIKILVFAETRSKAIERAKGVADDLTKDESPFDWWAHGEESRWPKIPHAMKVDTKKYPTKKQNGLEMVKSAMEATKRDFKESIENIRYMLDRYTTEYLFEEEHGPGIVEIDGKRIWDDPSMFKYFCSKAGEYYGSSIWLYDQDVQGIRTTKELDDILEHYENANWVINKEKYDKPLWIVIVPIDMHF